MYFLTYLIFTPDKGNLFLHRILTPIRFVAFCKITFFFKLTSNKALNECQVVVMPNVELVNTIRYADDTVIIVSGIDELRDVLYRVNEINVES